MKAKARLFLVWMVLFVVVRTYGQNDGIPINHLQVIGSHNSYKMEIDSALFRILRQRDSVGMSKIDYSHIGITDQLDLGLLNLEIDVYADVQGGRYAHPKGLDWAPNQPAYDTEGVMKKPGFKIFHIQDIDFRSHALTFQQCLQQLRKWSDAHPDHPPVFITMNAKDDVISKPGFTTPEKFTSAVFDLLDKEILDYLGAGYVITPDKIRGRDKTLEAAVLKNHWPTLKEARGKFIFILDENEAKRTIYITGHPALKGRVLFANATPGTPEAAICIMNNARRDSAAIKTLVKKGYIVRTRADSDTQEARANDKSAFQAAMQSGAQIITTDYYRKSTHFQSDYSISFDGNRYIRENPLFLPKPATSPLR